MIELICFLSPGFLAAKIYEDKQNKPFDGKKFIVIYLLFMVTINIFCLGIMAVVFHHPQYMLNSDLFNVGFIFKYLFLSFACASILPAVFEKFCTCKIIRAICRFSRKEGK